MPPPKEHPLTSRRQLLLGSACLGLAGVARAQPSYPVRPVRIIVPFAPGGDTDLAARHVAAKLTETLGYTIVIDNRPGAGGNVGAEVALREPADGHTLLVISGSYPANAALSRTTSEALAAIQPIVQFSNSPIVMVVAQTSTVRTLADLVERARSAPGTITYGSAGIGSLSNLIGEYFASSAGVSLTHVPYKGIAGALTDVAGGRIDMTVSGIGAVRPLVQGAKVRLLAVAWPTRPADWPMLPTFAEAGLPQFDPSLWHGLVASKDVPATIVERLNRDINTVLREPSLRARWAEDGATAAGGTPGEFRELIRRDAQRWERIVKDAGIKPG